MISARIHDHAVMLRATRSMPGWTPRWITRKPPPPGSTTTPICWRTLCWPCASRPGRRQGRQRRPRAARRAAAPAVTAASRGQDRRDAGSRTCDGPRRHTAPPSDCSLTPRHRPARTLVDMTGPSPPPRPRTRARPGRPLRAPRGTRLPAEAGATFHFGSSRTPAPSTSSASARAAAIMLLFGTGAGYRLVGLFSWSRWCSRGRSAAPPPAGA